jgi:hypothetical protein
MLFPPVLESELWEYRYIQEGAGPLSFLRELIRRAEERTAKIRISLMDEQLTDNMIHDLRNHTGKATPIFFMIRDLMTHTGKVTPIFFPENV